MELPIISIIVTLILVALLWWAVTQFVTDPMILKVARVVMVVLVCLWLVGLLTGRGPTLSFR
jgi:uncharacterized membrane protein YwzB